MHKIATIQTADLKERYPAGARTCRRMGNRGAAYEARASRSVGARGLHLEEVATGTTKALAAYQTAVKTGRLTVSEYSQAPAQIVSGGIGAMRRYIRGQPQQPHALNARFAGRGRRRELRDAHRPFAARMEFVTGVAPETRGHQDITASRVSQRERNV